MSLLLDDSFPAETRRNVGAVTIARLTTNACFRYAPPFLASISDDLQVSLGRLGVALMVTEIAAGIASLGGAYVDRLRRRTAMVIGLAGVSASTAITAGARNVPVFAVGIVLLAITKMVFDMGLAGWVNDHVDYERRGRVVGITETSWALGLLIGVSGMGLVASMSSWRWGYAAGAAAVALMAVVVAARTRGPEHMHAAHEHVRGARMPSSGYLVIASMFFLMASSQAIFVTFGAWLADDFGFSDARISAVVFGLGAFELLASVTSARRSDVWGKERSTIVGAMLIVPSGVLLMFLHDHLTIGLVLLGVYLLGFEFAIVSMIPIATNMIPGSPGKGLGLTYTGGMLARAVMSIVATASYDRWGIEIPAIMGATCAIGLVATMYPRVLLTRRSG